ncbi:MAG: hypothetical protein STSR0008_15570 [Ignavibacterium sp.]
MNSINKKVIKILIVDDSDVIQNALKHFFEQYNCEVYVCTDGLEGLKKAVEFKPNLILLDLMMPNFDGLKMLQVKSILNEIKDIPVIVISANTDKRNILSVIESGADRVISKPIRKEILVKNVQEILGDELFSNKRKINISESKSDEIKKELLNVFLKNFNGKKEKILTAISDKNRDTLKTLIHELKGAGGMIGYPEITKISTEIEMKQINSPTDWMFVQLQCDKIFQIVQNIQEEIN